MSPDSTDTGLLTEAAGEGAPPELLQNNVYIRRKHYKQTLLAKSCGVSENKSITLYYQC